MNVPSHEVGAPHFQYRSFDEGDHHIIRLLTIVALEADESDDAPIRGYLDHVHICKCALATGEAKDSLFSRKPTIYFDRYVRNRPREVFPIEEAHSTTLYEKCFSKPDPDSTLEDLRIWEESKPIKRLTKRVSKFFKSSDKSSQATQQEYEKAKLGQQLYTNALAKMARNPEDTGGGFSIYTPVVRKGRHSAPRDPQRPKAKPRLEVHRKFQWGNYVALSYSWGTEKSGSMMYLQNRYPGAHEANEEFGLIRITKNLESALRRLRTMRYFRHHGPVWIDALCINQADEKEKSSQLPLMPHIYGAAGNVLVWLGEGNKRLYEALDLVQKFGINYRTEWQEAMDDAPPHIAHQHREEVAVKFRIALEMWKVLAGMQSPDVRGDRLMHEFFTLPYWRRLWIIQELALGTSDMAFVLGERVTEWRYIRDTAFMLNAISAAMTESLPPGFKDPVSFSHIARIAQLEIRGHRKALAGMNNTTFGTHLNSGPADGPVRGSALWQAFRLMANAKCYDPKDRIFGILALPGLPDLGIETNYTKSVIAIYKEFTIACIKASYYNPFQVFCLLDGTRREGEQENHPSWVPNFSSDRRTGIIDGEFKAGYKWCPSQAMGWVNFDDIPQYKFVDGNLQVRAVIIDVVDGLGGISKSSKDAEDETFLRGLYQPTKMPLWPLEDSKPASSIWRCFVADADENGTKYPEGYDKLLDVFAGEESYYEARWQRDKPVYDFIAANAELLVDGRSLSSYLTRWTDNPNMQQQRINLGYHGFFEEWESLRAQTITARKTMQTSIRNKRLMVSGRGMLGLVPNSVIVGDVVIIIRGHGKPLVASRLESRDGGHLYSLKGEAYIDGMMGGEMMEDEVEKSWETITFV